MLLGQPPFLDSSLMGLYEKIMRCEIVWRDDVVHLNDQTKDLIVKLLQPEENLRLGGGCNGAREVMDHRSDVRGGGQGGDGPQVRCKERWLGR